MLIYKYREVGYMYKKYISVFSFIILLMLIYSNVFAHSGRTDTLGGHKDNKNVSGLGQIV